MLFQQVRKLQETEVNKYLNRNSPFSGIWENIIHNDGDDLPEETKSLITEYLHPKLKKLFDEQESNNFVYYLPGNKAFKTSNLTEIELSNKFISPVFKVLAVNDHFEIVCMVKLNDETVSFSMNECDSSLVFLYDNILYLWQKPEDVLQAEKFNKRGNIQLSKSNWAEKMQKIILPLTREYEVEFDKKLVKEIKSGAPEVKLQLLADGRLPCISAHIHLQRL